MATNRREFIKRSLGAVSASLLMPKIFFARSPLPQPDSARRVFVVIELAGGNDGLNTVIPYTDSRYYSLRPMLSLKDTELKDAQGNSTIISDKLGLHPSMSKLKGLYDAGKVAVVLGVGYPEPNGSHFESADIWHTGRIEQARNEGWLGRYANQALVGKPGLTAIAVDDRLPKSFQSGQVVIPNVPNFDDYGIQTDPFYEENRSNKINTLMALQQRSFPAGSFAGQQARIGIDALTGALEFRSALDTYTSTIEYPENNSLADGLQMLAQIIVTIPAVNLLYVQVGGFDTHSEQTTDNNKLQGQHPGLLQDFSDAVDAFYRDMAEHQLADKVVMMQWSEFGRRPNENKSLGTDHGTASSIFVIGDPVHGGIYGRQPSLDVTELDDAENMVFNLDFRSVYATILDRWLGSDSTAILGKRFEDVGFFG